MTVVIAGLGHTGMVAAVSFVLSPQYLRELDRRAPSNWRNKNIEVVLENKHLLKDVLRTDWGFHGFVVSDFGAAHDGGHDLSAGLDLEMPQGDTYNSNFEQQVKDGIVTTTQIGELLRHRYATMIRLGLI
jgi:hypothetical protein